MKHLIILLSFIFAGQAKFVSNTISRILFSIAAVSSLFYLQYSKEYVLYFSLLCAMLAHIIHIKEEQFPFISSIVSALLITIGVYINSHLVVLLGSILLYVAQVEHIKQDETVLDVTSYIGIGLLVTYFIIYLFDTLKEKVGIYLTPILLCSIGILYILQLIFIRVDTTAMLLYLLGPSLLIAINST